jgi:hypothetical protein
MVLRPEAPTAPPTCCIVLTIAEATRVSAGGTL